jgi:hypothetical protein
MSHFRTPGPPTRDKRRIAHLRLWLVMIIGSAWTNRGPWRPPGRPRRGSVPGTTRCQECGQPAKRQSNGLYICPNEHTYIRLTNGKFQRAN